MNSRSKKGQVTRSELHNVVKIGIRTLEFRTSSLIRLLVNIDSPLLSVPHPPSRTRKATSYRLEDRSDNVATERIKSNQGECARYMAVDMEDATHMVFPSPDALLRDKSECGGWRGCPVQLNDERAPMCVGKHAWLGKSV